jgi:hypothetical protein
MRVSRFTVAKRWLPVAVLAVAAAGLSAGCGSSGGSKPSEAQSAASGDIPDNQVFLRYNDSAAGFSIKYPEGWARRGSGSDVTFQDKDNVIHATVTRGPAPTTASVSAELAKLKTSGVTPKGAPQKLAIHGTTAIKSTYTRQSSPDPVTGKRLSLIVDRYEYGHAGRRAVLELSTPTGVDNVDAYRLISESFRWQ